MAFLKSNWLPALFLIILAGVFYGTAETLSSSGRGLGPGFVPQLWAGVLVGLCLVMIMQSFIQPTFGELMAKLTPSALRLSAFTVAALVLYALLLPWAGYVVSTLVFLTGLIGLFGERRPWRLALLSLIVTFSLYWVFQHVLGVPLPTGMFL